MLRAPGQELVKVIGDGRQRLYRKIVIIHHYLKKLEENAVR
jgi:hypothetical protein